MYRRADLSRAMILVVALLLTAVSTSVFAREFRAADTQSEDYPTVQALRYVGSPVAERSGGSLQLKVFHSRQFGEEKETLEQTRAGAIDLNRTNVALIGYLVPAVKVRRTVERRRVVVSDRVIEKILVQRGSLEARR